MTRTGELAAEHTLGRRSLLIFTGAAGLALAGCTDSPLDPGPGPKDPPTPKPEPLPGTVQAAATEKELARYADALLAEHSDHLDSDQRRLVEQLRDAHLAHLAVLTSAAPFELPQPSPSGSATPQSPAASGSATASASPGPSGSAPATASPTPAASATPTVPVPGSPAKALKKFRSLESTATTEHRGRLLKPAPTGSTSVPEDQQRSLALLWASLSAAAAGYHQALSDGTGPATDPTGTRRVAIALPARADAAKNLLQQCYAIIFGYQTALAKLSGRRADQATSALAGYRTLRDRLVTELLAQDQKPPAAGAAYKLPIQPTSSSRAGRLIGSMETAMLPFLGQWLATTTDRRNALGALTDSTRNALAWTSAITVWPGWPTQD